MKVTCFCAVDAGLLTIKFALDLGVKIERVIGLNPKIARYFDKVSGLVDISSFCKKNKLNFKYVDDYSLKKINPKSILSQTDIIWVVGWQRLLPSSFVNFPKIATIGSHGSIDGILKGRGRSPQNWAILMGKKKFIISMFKITEGVDDGKIILTKKFNYNVNDTILNSYVKASICTAKSFNQLINNPTLISKAKIQKGKPEYFPKRIPEDGFIDWNMSSIDIFNQIRSLSKPYPRARSMINKNIIYINKSSYLKESFSNKYGRIVFKFSDDKILVACGQGSLVIEDYEIEDKALITVNNYFNSISQKKIVKDILKRFKKDFPGKNINNSLLGFWKKRKLI